MPPGSLEGLLLVVSDIEAARAHLVEGDVEVSEVRHFEHGVWRDRSRRHEGLLSLNGRD